MFLLNWILNDFIFIRTGKTHTMMGCPKDPGLIESSIHDLFALLDASEGKDFLLRVSYMEIYNENVTDLLAPDVSWKTFL